MKTETKLMWDQACELPAQLLFDAANKKTDVLYTINLIVGLQLRQSLTANLATW